MNRSKTFGCALLATAGFLAGCGGGGGGGGSGSANAPHIYGSVIADVDGDGHPDIIHGVSGRMADLVYLNEGNGQFPKANDGELPPHYLGAGGETIFLDAADMDGDADVDIVAIDVDGRQDTFYQSAQVQLYLNDGTGHFTDATSRLPGNGLMTGWAQVATIADLDRDGHPDLLVSGSTPLNGTIWLNDGAGHFAAGSVTVSEATFSGTVTATLPTLDSPVVTGSNGNLVVGDIDNDGAGVPDAVALYGQYSFLNRSTPGSLAFDAVYWSDGIDPAATACIGVNQGVLVDDNQDGLRDLVMADISNAETPVPMIVCRNTGSGHFVEDTGAVFGSGSPGTTHPRRLIAADFDGDGLEDVYVADHGFDVSPFPGYPNTLLRNNGDGTFTDASGGLSRKNSYTHGASVGDVNGDGLPDLFENNSWSGIAAEQDSLLFINQGGMVFSGV